MQAFGHLGLSLAVAYGVERLFLRRPVQRKSRSRPQLLHATPPTGRSRTNSSEPDQPSLDYRLVVLGSVLPDIIDKPVGLWLAPRLVNSSPRSFGHSLLFNLVLTLLALALRGKPRSRQSLVLASSSISHVALDAMWRHPASFLWPAQGWRFTRGGSLPDRSRLSRLTSEAAELAGLGVIVGVGVKLYRRRSLLRFLRSGFLS